MSEEKAQKIVLAIQAMINARLLSKDPESEESLDDFLDRKAKMQRKRREQLVGLLTNDT